MLEWLIDELPYWTMKIEYCIWMITLAFIKYFIEGCYEVWKLLKALWHRLMKD